MYFFTLIASLPFLFTLLLIKSKVNTFNFFFLRFFNEFTFFEDSFFWFTFFLAFAVKLPIMPLHLWLPEAHVEASTGGSVLLAGILLKLGAYAIFRFLLSFFLLSFSFYSIFIMFFSFFSIFIASLLAITQIDLKRLVAYSSVAHMGFCFFAFFSDIFVGYLGAFFLLFSHAFVSSSLFLLIGFLYDRYKTRSIFYLRGIITFMPLAAFFIFLNGLANIAFPGFFSFLTEFFLLLSALEFSLSFFIIVVFSTLLTLIYTFRSFFLFLYGFFPTLNFFYIDFDFRELALLFFLLFFSIFLGFFPKFFLILICF